MGNIDLSKVSTLINEITKESKDAICYNTGLLGEAIYVASYKRLDTPTLEKIRFIINKIIKERKEQKYHTKK